MGLTEKLTLAQRGNQPIHNYIAYVRDIADELAMLGTPVPYYPHTQ